MKICSEDKLISQKNSKKFWSFFVSLYTFRRSIKQEKMKLTWDDIIASPRKEIQLIGYGSILNSSTNEGDTTQNHTVIVKGFQRIYNLKMVPL